MHFSACFGSFIKLTNININFGHLHKSRDKQCNDLDISRPSGKTLLIPNIGSRHLNGEKMQVFLQKFKDENEDNISSKLIENWIQIITSECF